MNSVKINIPRKEKVEYTHGDLFRHTDGDIYILARLTSDCVKLINLSDGDRWTEDTWTIDDLNKHNYANSSGFEYLGRDAKIGIEFN